MEREDFIETRDDVIQNIKTLYSYLSDKDDGDKYLWAVERMKSGKNFVVEKIDNHIRFAPSRFVGYVNNTKEKHEENWGDGKDTDNVLKRFYQKIEDDRLDDVFQTEIESLEISTGHKKYWIPKEMSVLDYMPQKDKIMPTLSSYLDEDRYWHIQMHLPYGRNDVSIDSKKMLEGSHPVIGTGEWDNYQCRNFKSLPIGTIILVRRGNTAIALCQITGENFNNNVLTDKYLHANFRDVRVLAWADDYQQPDSTLFSTGTMSCCNSWTRQYKYINQWIKSIIMKTTFNKWKSLLEQKKNIILQGAPGTGKTYNTAALALSICGVTDVDFNDHTAVMNRYERLRYDEKDNPDGQIGFCTFHQSMDYEDFVEGIKPKTENGVVSYNVEDGIFKTMCKNANQITTEKKSGNIDFTQTRVFKMSLGEKGKDDEEIFNYCYENNVVALGWGDNIDFSSCKKREDFQAKYSEKNWGSTAMETFKELMKKDDIVLVSDGTKAVKAIAKIDGEYEYIDNAPIEMYQFRKVEWLYTGDSIPISKLYDKNLSQQSIYGFYNSNKFGKTDFNGGIKTDVLNDIITGEINIEPVQNYVLIIDEINRGNVSRIFGELITLVEADKRLDAEHPIKVTLPYSEKTFGVPSNLYIIGTMNTTDRSTGTLDYALRRRFAFTTLKSDVSIVKKHYDTLGDEELEKTAIALFNNIKEFINNPQHLCGDFDIDDLMVGHSYFMAKKREELENKVEYEVIPLINEYINDGILKVDATEKTKAFEAWKNLNTININKDDDYLEEDDDVEKE